MRRVLILYYFRENIILKKGIRINNLNIDN
jgi:hypothetical protein